MDEQEYKEFLSEIANKVDKLILKPANMHRFRNQMKLFGKMRKAWNQKIEQHKEKAESDPRLQNEEAGTAKEGWVWDQYQGFWRPEKFPPDPMEWIPGSPTKDPTDEDALPDPKEGVWPLGSPTRDPTDDEKLMCDYFLLTVIHDGALTGLTDKRISFDTCYREPKQGCIYMWTDLDGGSIMAIPSEAMQLWKYLSKCDHDKIRAKIERSLKHVEADLAKLPAEKETGTAPASKQEKDTAKTISTVNIQNFRGVLGDVQAENIQTGDHASIHKQIQVEKKSKASGKVFEFFKKIIAWVFKKTSHLIFTIIVGIIVTILIDICGDFGWLDNIKAFIYKILPGK